MFLDHAGLYDELKGRGLVTCSVCGSENTELDPQLFPLRAMKPDDMPSAPTGLVQLAAMLVCMDCGYIRLHAMGLAKKRQPAED